MLLKLKKLIPFLIICWTLAVTVARALRLPNDFSEAHWLLDYRFGFMKRALVGAVCGLVLRLTRHQMTPELIVVLSGIIGLCFLAGLLVIVQRLLARKAPGDATQLMCLVFASSPFFVMHAHCFGYFDALLYLLALGAVALTLRDRPFPAALISAAALLIHESYLLIGLPLVCFAVLARLSSGSAPVRWRLHVLAQCLPLAAFLAVCLFPAAADRLAVREQLAGYLDMCRFVSTRSVMVANWQTTTFLEVFRSQLPELEGRLLNHVALASVGPSLLAILYCCHASFRLKCFSLFSLMLLAAACAPFAMHVVATDVLRITTFTLGGAFIAFWILAETRQQQSPGSIFALLALPTLLVNIFFKIPLMDEEVEGFSNLARLLLYAPALLLSCSIIARNMQPGFLADFRTTRPPDA